MAAETITMSLVLPADIYEAIKAEAAADHCSVNAVLIMALNDHVRRRNESPAEVGELDR